MILNPRVPVVWTKKQEKNHIDMKEILKILLELFPHLDIDVLSNSDVDQDLADMVKTKPLIRNRFGFLDLDVVS